MQSSLYSLIVSAAALIAVLALAWLCIKVMAKFYINSTQNGIVRIVETHSITPKDRLVVVSYNNQHYLLGVSGQGIRLIDQNTAPADQTVLEPQVNSR